MNRHFLRISIFIFAFVSIQVFGGEFVKFGKYGKVIIDDKIWGTINHFGPDWQSRTLSARSVKFLDKSKHKLSGYFATTSGQSFTLEERLAAKSSTDYDFFASLKNSEGIDTKMLCLALNIPIEAAKPIKIDNTDVILPKGYSKQFVFQKKSAKRFTFQLADSRLVIEGDLHIAIQDNRKYNTKSFSIRFMFSPYKGKITKSTINLKIRKEYASASTIDIASVVNMGFKDEQANDQKGGWTDQGPFNDLRMMKPGTKRFGGVPFKIIDPQQNNGKSCLVMAGACKTFFPKSAEIPGNNASYNYLYFLHTAAWAGSRKDYGIVNVIYKDDSSSTFSVKGRRDVADWWGCYPLANGAVAWTSENKSSYVGLYMSKFKILDKPISKIKISSTGKAVWIIVGLSGSKEDIPLPKNASESYIIAGKEWKPFKHSLQVEKGSALDLSFMNDAPAGKYGRVIIKNGKFVFENKPDKPIRFYGVNLCFGANYLPKKDAEDLANRLVAYGYNSVRIHHQDRDLVNKRAKDSLTIRRDFLDRLDYLFYCLKKRGIYITTDIYISRVLKASEVKELDKNSRRIKALVPLSEDIANNLKEFARLTLNHVNPYTGIAWKDDPALFGISLVNENALPKIWNRNPISTKAYETAFAKWVKQNNIPVDTQKQKSAALTQFIINMQIKSFNILKTYIKDELGCKALLSDNNMGNYISQTLPRDQYDYVDNHAYWDHPKFPVKSWNLPISFHNKSVLPKFCRVPISLMPTRIIGKPFTLTEYNYVFPNEHRAEGNPIIGALASLQGWDAVYRFDFGWNKDIVTTVVPTKDFCVAADPLTLLGERIVTLMFRRGDVKVAQKLVPFLVTPNCSQVIGTENGSGENFPADYENLGLVHQLGSMVTKPGFKLPTNTVFAVSAEKIDKSLLHKTPLYVTDNALIPKLLKDGVLSKTEFNPETGKTLSDTGEIALDTKGKTFSVVTEKTESFVLPAGKDMKGKILSVSDNTSFATIFASSLDENSLVDSKRILILHLTDIKNTKTKFHNSEFSSLITAIGTLPHLVRNGKMQVNLAIKRAERPTLWALDMTGKRIEKVDVKQTSDGLSFIASTAGNGTSRMAYELVW